MRRNSLAAKLQPTLELNFAHFSSSSLYMETSMKIAAWECCQKLLDEVVWIILIIQILTLK